MNSNPIKILWASPFVPYDSVGHAGGKSHNFYIKGISADPRFHVTLISFGQESERPKVDFKDTRIDARLDFLRPGLVAKAFRGATLFLPFSRFGQFFRHPQFRTNLESRVKQLVDEDYRPDVIFLEWTQVAFFQQRFRKAFPGVPVVVYEHDIAFQAAKRHANALSGLRAILASCQLHFLRKAEIRTLEQADMVVVHNSKDKGLLGDAGIDCGKIQTVPLYYNNDLGEGTDIRGSGLLYWGAMSRPENHVCIMHFLKEAWPLLQQRHPNLHFFIVGGGPPEELRKMASDRVTITGFVQDPSSFFALASVMVAPLTSGGGLKVKILESMAAGLAVVGNAIAMEGIGALPGVHYVHAESMMEFVEAASQLTSDPTFRERISCAGRNFVLEHFDFQAGLSQLKLILSNLGNSGRPEAN